VVAGLSLRIAPGEKVALVGPAGAGKSTLARLLLGLHLPEAGSIRFDGRDLRTLDLQKLRNRMGVVLQETFLFDDTVRANLALHDDHLPQERLAWAVAMACQDPVIAGLPQGYESRVGANGELLSGGQRQRLSLARALAGNPGILLLDEATSSLDLETEARIHANLASLRCTRIIIAHRLATVRDADRILVLQAGRIAQEGTFAELKDAPGLFRDLLAGAGHA
jgi:ABC-type bacteriocin/lantibiotic exporter with double-glycine peptidase domain